MVRFILELINGLAIAAIVTALVMITMFYFGPWADPPGIDALCVPDVTASPGRLRRLFR